MSKQSLIPKLNKFKQKNKNKVLDILSSLKYKLNCPRCSSNQPRKLINRIYQQNKQTKFFNKFIIKDKVISTLMLQQYQRQLNDIQRKDRESIASYRATLTNIKNNTKQKNKNTEQEQSQRGIASIQMYEVNPDTIHYERMIQIKEKQINHIKGRMQDAIKVQQDMKNLVVSQGQKLNQVQDNIDVAQENVNQAHENLVEAVDLHMKNKKRKMICFCVILFLVIIVTVPIIVKFT